MTFPTPHDPTSSANPSAPQGNSSKWIAGGAIVLALLAVGTVPRVLRAHEADSVVRASPVLYPEVLVIHPEGASGSSTLSLPSDLQPIYTASVYARTNGYVSKRFVDIGTRVKKGQLLALIATPEIDQQLLQAQATVEQAKAALQQSQASLQQAQANMNLARITQQRYAKLNGTRAVTQQSFDEADQTYNARVADVTAAKANISMAEANLQARTADKERIAQLKGFEQVVAPFDGVITARNVEQGDLVNDGSNSGTKSLFTVAQDDMLRVQVEVPQSAALSLQPGQHATVTVDERPGDVYTATIVRTASSVDVAARMMLTEVQVDNHHGALLSGMYGQVHFQIPRNTSSFMIPTTALVINKDGMHVVSVAADNTVHFVPVDIGRDMGAQVEIVAGLHGGESLVTNPSDLLQAGEKVTVAQP